MVLPRRREILSRRLCGCRERLHGGHQPQSIHHGDVRAARTLPHTPEEIRRCHQRLRHVDKVQPHQPRTMVQPRALPYREQRLRPRQRRPRHHDDAMERLLQDILAQGRGVPPAERHARRSTIPGQEPRERPLRRRDVDGESYDKPVEKAMARCRRAAEQGHPPEAEHRGQLCQPRSRPL